MSRLLLGVVMLPPLLCVCGVAVGAAIRGADAVVLMLLLVVVVVLVFVFVLV